MESSCKFGTEPAVSISHRDSNIASKLSKTFQIKKAARSTVRIVAIFSDPNTHCVKK